MKKLLLAAIFLSAAPAIAADFQVSANEAKTISVTDCAKDEIGVVSVISNISGEHKIIAKCLPLTCAYTNETQWPGTVFGTKWTIMLLAKTEEHPPGFLTSPQFDRSPGMFKILNKGVKTKDERDSLIDRYLADGLCRDRYYDRSVQSI
jgi:hypothetical protein